MLDIIPKYLATFIHDYEWKKQKHFKEKVAKKSFCL